MTALDGVASNSKISGFMNGSPPVKPISVTASHALDLVEIARDLVASQIGEPVVRGFDSM